MIIQAKFASTCGSCGGRIRVGEKVEWSKGRQATHVTCQPQGAKPVAAPSRRVPAEGEQCISRYAQGRGDRYRNGDVVRMKGSDSWFVVVSEWMQAPNEDMGDYEWRAVAIVRAATASEATKANLARTARERAQRLAALPTLLVSLVRHSENHLPDGIVPAGAWRYTIGARAGGSEILYFTPEALYYSVSSYDDVPHVWRVAYGVDVAAALVAAVDSLGAA